MYIYNGYPKKENLIIMIIINWLGEFNSNDNNDELIIPKCSNPNKYSSGEWIKDGDLIESKENYFWESKRVRTQMGTLR